MKSKEQIFSHIQESSPLPSLPHVLIKLIDVCDDDTIPIQEIAPVVAKDPSLSSKVLQLVNSAYFGLNRTFSDLEQAVVYLGASTIKNLAITASVQQVFKGLKKQNSIQIGFFWYSSLLSATLSKRISQSIKYANTEEAYLAGLLHNIGQLLLSSSFPDKTGAIQKNTTGPELCEEENLLMGITHCEAGAWLLKKWKISPFIADVAFYHHHSSEQIKEAFPLVKIGYVAAFLAELIEEDHQKGLNLGLELLGLDEATTKEILSGAREEVLEIARNLGVEIGFPESERLQKPTAESSSHPDNGEKQHTSFPKKNLQLTETIKNESLLTGFLRKLIQTEGLDNILAATEEIARILFASQTVFFLLFDKEQKQLVGHCSFENPQRELVKDLALPASNQSSLVFSSLIEKKILIPFNNSSKQPTNLADIQLFNIIDTKTMAYVPLVAHGKKIGIIVLNLPETSRRQLDESFQQLTLIANQTAIAIYLERVQQQEAQKLHSERMATASLAAQKIVHEVNNPLGIISNYLRLLEIKLSDETAIQAELKIIEEEINRISTILAKLNDFADPQGHDTENISINKLIGNMLRILFPALLEPSGVQLHFTPDPSLYEIKSERDTIKQIILNLVKNAAEAMKNGGALRISTANIVETALPSGVLITIDDNGPGIPDEIQKKLFSPFLTTKKLGHSGLGLSIVHRAVEDLGGTITCESNPETGTQFTISLPLKPIDTAIKSEV